MNVGYVYIDKSKSLKSNAEMICPLCGSNVYGSKYGKDYKCINANCVLNQGAGTVIEIIQKSLENF